MTLLEQLEDLNNQIAQLNPELPKEFGQIIELNCRLMKVYGALHAAATYDYGLAYAKRKGIWGKALMETEGTATVKEGRAEVVAFKYRTEEAAAESEAIKWKNAFTSQSELIQAQKLELKLLAHEMGIQV